MAHKNGVPDAKFWLGKRVLVTGHTGFKGGLGVNNVKFVTAIPELKIS